MGETKKKQRRAPSPPELYPGHAAELKKKARRDRRIAQANAEPFPGPLDAAFAQGPVQIGGFTVRELVPIDVKLLKRLDSPFYRQMLELLKPKEQRQRTPVADEQEWEIIYLFTRPSLEAEAELDRSLAGFRHAARLAFAHNPRINVAVYQRLYNACANRIIRAFATAVAYEARSLCGDDEVFYDATAGADDGLGWWLKYVGRLLRCYPQFTMRAVLYELPMAQGWALLNVATEQSGWPGYDRISDGYVAQEMDRLS